MEAVLARSVEVSGRAVGEYMQYVGGKFRSARFIAEEVAKARRPEQDRIVEPFLGGGASFSRLAPMFDHALACDVVPDLVEMWNAAILGWVPPSHVSEEEYSRLRHAEPSALRGFVGFGCSFGGKWFGGYARSRSGAAPNYNYAAGASRSVVKQAALMRHANIGLMDYRELEILHTDVVYCDPPYSGTTGYSSAGEFDSNEFWRIAERWATSGATVLVSEYTAPKSWSCVWQRGLPNYLRGTGQVKNERVERLFAMRCEQ